MENRLRQLEQMYTQLLQQEQSLQANLRGVPVNSPVYHNMNQQLASVSHQLRGINSERESLRAQLNMQRGYQQPAYGGYAPQPQYGGYQQPGGYPPPGGYPMAQQPYYPQQPAYRPAPQPYYPPNNGYGYQPPRPNYQQPIQPMNGYGNYGNGYGGYQQPYVGQPQHTNHTSDKYERYANRGNPQPQQQQHQQAANNVPVIRNESPRQPEPAKPINKAPKIDKVVPIVEILDNVYKGCEVTPSAGQTRTLPTKRTRDEVERVASKFKNLVNKDNNIKSANVTNLRALVKELAILDEPGRYIDKLLTSYLNTFLKMNDVNGLQIESIITDFEELIQVIEKLDNKYKEGFKDSLLRLVLSFSSLTMKYVEKDGEFYVDVYHKATSINIQYGHAGDELEPIRNNINNGVASEVSLKNAPGLFNILSKHPDQNIVSVVYDHGTLDRNEVFFYKVDDTTYISIPNPILL